MKGELEGQHGEISCFTKKQQKQEVRCRLLWRFIAVTTNKEAKVRAVEPAGLKDWKHYPARGANIKQTAIYDVCKDVLESVEDSCCSAMPKAFSLQDMWT